jgi:hypothetical protein
VHHSSFREAKHHLPRDFSLRPLPPNSDLSVTWQRAEELLFGNTVKQYEKWRACADVDPEWGSHNPFEIVVSVGSGGLGVRYLSRLDEKEGR